MLDTDVFSYLLKGDTKGEPYKRHVTGRTLAVSFVTVGELYAGARKRNWGPRRLEILEQKLRSVIVVPFDLQICHAYAEMATLKQPSGHDRVIAANDRWIAACAIRHGLPLISNNRRHFEGIPDLILITEAPPRPAPKAQTLKGLGESADSKGDDT